MIQLQKLLNQSTERGPFEKALHFTNEGQNSQISRPVMIYMEELTHVHPILKRYFQKKKSKMCPSREDKGISASLETADK